MAGNLTENFNELCRLCATKINLAIGIGINIFQGEGTTREISKKISTCLPVQVHEADRLPKMICGDCVYKLDLCFQFHEKCLNTENLLIEIIRSNSIINLDKIRESKTLDLVTTVDNQQLQIVRNQELLDHSNISLSHDDNMIVNQQIILNVHENIGIHNHELDNIEITPHELNSHGITHNNIHAPQLELHHESAMAQLVQPDIQINDSQLTVQNLELIHTQHNLITNHYDTMHNKTITTDDNCVANTIITIKEQIDVSPVKAEEVKSENQADVVMVKATYSDGSDTESSMDGDFDSTLDNSGGEKPNELVDNNVYDQNNYILNSSEAEVGASGMAETTDYYCSVCGKTLNDKDEYLEHFGEHINKCLVCQEDFNNLEELLAHREQIHRSHDDKMEQSTSKARLIRTTKNNVKEAHDDNFFKEESSEDEKNSAEFINDNDEDEFVVERADDGTKGGKRKRYEPKVCKECGKVYKTNYKLAEHMRKHTGEQPFKCSMCDKAFRSKIGLAQHEAKHTGNFDYSCTTCGKGFQCKSYLIVHQRVHSNVKPYPCSQCGKDFKTKQSLLDHMNRHLGLKPFICELCGRGFITKGLWKSHQKVHSGRDNRQFPCTVCNKLFVSKSYLTTHLRIHTGEKPFICEACGKGFLTRVDLRIHSTMHTGEKSYVCEMCGKAFARRDALRCHRRSHTGERPYRCDICGQTFTQFSPMAIHKRLHTGERPYTCEVCNRTFVSRSTMMAHRKKHVP